MSALCASLVAPPPDPDAPVPEVQESLLGSPAANEPTSEEQFPGGQGCGHRRINRYDHRNSRARVLRERVGDASRAEGHGAELDGDGAGTPTAVWGSLGQRPTKGPSPITPMGPCPPPQSGAGTNPSRGRCEWQRAGLDGRRKACSMRCRTCAATQGDAGVLTRAQRRAGGVVRFPRFALHRRTHGY